MQLLPNIESVTIETPKVYRLAFNRVLSPEQGCTDENKQWLWNWANRGSSRTVQVAFEVLF